MSVLFHCIDVPAEPWLGRLRAALPDVDFRAWPDFGDPEAVEAAILWGRVAGEMRRFPRLRAIFSLGAGVEHILGDPECPDVPVVRLVDPGLKTGMVEYVLMRVLHYHRHMPDYGAQQRLSRWRERPQHPPSGRRVGIMGMGELGGAVAAALAGLGFAVAGWSRSPRQAPQVESFAGSAGLGPFLARSDILVNLLPLTAETENILNRETLSRLPRGAFLINVGRGGHLVDADLLAALESGALAGATLDVFRTEPLPADHPFWTHPKITVTPHIAALTMPETAVPVIAANISRLRAGLPLHDVVDPARGY